MKYNLQTFKYFPITVISITFCSLFISCKSPEQHADSAFDILKQKKEMQGDSVNNILMITPVPNKTVIIEQIEMQDEWTKFKISSEKKIKTNDLKIEQLSNLNNTSDKTLKHLIKLKTENIDLRRIMDEYKESEKVRWENFKTSFNHDINTIEIDLKDLNNQVKN